MSSSSPLAKPPSPSSNWDPSHLPDLTGKTVLITGGHSGLGLATTIHLARKGAKVYVASRDVVRAEDAVRGVRESVPAAMIGVIRMDLADLESVKRGVDEFLR